jgi:hypothetical protein
MPPTNSEINNQNNETDSLNKTENSLENFENSTPVDIAKVAQSLEESDQNITATGSNDSNEQPRSVFSQSVESTNTTPKAPNKIISYLKGLDRYTLIFLFFIIIVIFLIFYLVEKNKNPTSSIKTQTLSQSTLSQLNNNDIQVGGSQQILNVQSNSIFDGTVLIKSQLQVAGDLSSQNINISGNSQLNTISSNSLVVSGVTTLKGQLAVGGGLNVTGTTILSGAVSVGALTANSLQVNGDISVLHHLVTNGTNPTISNLGSIGSGGTTSINGTDTAGTININFGSGAANNSCDVAINFSQSFSVTPVIVISPSNSFAATTNYYIANKSKTGFDLCNSNPSSLNTATFDYMVIG